MIQVVYRYEDANCITHSGTMHADEVFSTAFLDLYLGNIKVLRTSKIDFSKVTENHLVYDIGRGKYDHHQPDALIRNNGIPYCSIGLLWKDFGRDFLRKYGIEKINEVFIAMDHDLIEGIDADDNGVFPKIEANYRVKTLPNVIKLFNPSYASGEIEAEQFEKACMIAKEILNEEVLYINGKVEAESKILELLEHQDSNTHYLVLDRFLPYEDVILQNEKAKSINFVAYPSNRGGYAIKVVPKSIEDKTPRVQFPEEWAALEGEELEEVSGIDGLTFCHAGRFLVTCSNIDAVYKVLNKVTIDC